MRNVSVLVLLVVLLTACGGGDGEDPAPSGESNSESTSTTETAEPAGELEDAVETCRTAITPIMEGIAKDDAPPASEVLTMDNGSLLISTPEPQGEIAASFAFVGAGCVLERLGAPGSVEQRMGSASAMSGPGEAEWDGFAASWSFNDADGVFEASIDAVG